MAISSEAVTQPSQPAGSPVGTMPEDLEPFNDAIVGKIAFAAEYRGDPPRRIR